MTTPASLMTPAKAEAVAEELNQNDDGWTYRVRHDPQGTGWSFIDVYDEDGAYVGPL